METNDYRCENCYSFDDTEVPAVCKKGHGKVAYLKAACKEFKLKVERKETKDE